MHRGGWKPKKVSTACRAFFLLMLKDSEEKSLTTAFDSMERLKEKGLDGVRVGRSR